MASRRPARAVRPDIRIRPLKPEQLRWRCTPDMLGVSDMSQAKATNAIIGQNRALRAIRTGLEMQATGYNIFVTGQQGTGRTTTIQNMLQHVPGPTTPLTDKVYVHNFHNPDSPILLLFPAGEGMKFRKSMASFVADLQKNIPAVFESRRYVEQRKSMLEHFQDRQRSVLRDFEKRVKERGFEVVQVQGGGTTRPEIAPVFDGAPLSAEQLQAKVDAGEVPKEKFAELTAMQADLEGQMDIVMREMRNIERKAKKSLEDLTHKIVVPAVDELLEEVKDRFTVPKLDGYLTNLRTDILENVSRFHQKEEQPQGMLGLSMPREEDDFLEYQVNVVVDNSDVRGVPVILEKNPRYKNLFGTVDRDVDRNGLWRSDFTKIKAGSIAKADGGYLVLHALDMLTEPGVWPTLKRVLRHRQIEIQAFESAYMSASSSMKPEPIELSVKVIIIGDPYLYQMLYAYDEDFKKIFKIRADFDTEIPRANDSINSYVSFVKSMCERENLLPFEPSGVCAVVEYGVRLAGRQDKLSTRFSMLADVAREAHYWASQEAAGRVTDAHVLKAIGERIDRVKLIEEKIQEMIVDGSILIDTAGAVIGQVNGLSVYQTGEHEFGKPARITAKTSVGRGGIINIEREASMSGPSHNKGILIIGGYLRGKYAQKHPLVLSASIAFEQSYSGVDGDSASSTEIYALLSSLSGLPLDQGIAVTGSVNQHGDIQPIGGVNLKIEGFFDVCRERGLNGRQGVIIPHQNLPDLMLRNDVVEAAGKGLFQIYAVKSVDEGIEILTGVAAPKVHLKVEKRLQEFARIAKKRGA